LHVGETGVSGRGRQQQEVTVQAVRKNHAFPRIPDPSEGFPGPPRLQVRINLKQGAAHDLRKAQAAVAFQPAVPPPHNAGAVSDENSQGEIVNGDGGLAAIL
jgi:hypothetical protein